MGSMKNEANNAVLANEILQGIAVRMGRPTEAILDGIISLCSESETWGDRISSLNIQHTAKLWRVQPIQIWQIYAEWRKSSQTV